MNCLELFSGTHSVGKVLTKLEHNVISLDLKNATINCNILDWDYTIYKPGHFDYIHASPPCDTFSNLRRSWIGRKLKAHGDTIITKEILDEDEQKIGLVILNKTLEIIKYFNPKYFTIENPQTGNMKKYINDIFYTDVDYCKYGFSYKKRTRIWNNFNFEGLKCNKDCNFINKNKHLTCIGEKDSYTLNEKYRIPEQLILDWISCLI